MGRIKREERRNIFGGQIFGFVGYLVCRVGLYSSNQLVIHLWVTTMVRFVYKFEGQPIWEWTRSFGPESVYFIMCESQMNGKFHSYQGVLYQNMSYKKLHQKGFHSIYQR